MNRVRRITLSLGLTLAVGLLSIAPLHAVPTRVLTGVTIAKPGKTFLAPLLFFGRDGVVRIMAPNGSIGHTWKAEAGAEYGHPEPVGKGGILTFKSYDDDRLSLVELDWQGRTLFEFFEPEGVTFHHDFGKLDNGNYLVLCSKEIERKQISDKILEDDCLMEVNGLGEVVWEWQTADHFEEFGFDQEVLDGIYEAGGDWAHANSAEEIPTDTSHTDPRFMPGDVVISYRHTSRVVVVDRETGVLNWIGQISIGQHNARMLPDSVPGGGNITVFDNGFGEDYDSVLLVREYSRVVEYDPIAKTQVWEYTASDSNLSRWHFYSHFISGAQRLPNGNTLICEGALGRVFEVTPEGEIVWEFVSPYISPDDNPKTNRLYRAEKVLDPDWFP